MVLKHLYRISVHAVVFNMLFLEVGIIRIDLLLHTTVISDVPI